MKLTQISKLLGNLWNELMPPEKRIFEEKDWVVIRKAKIAETDPELKSWATVKSRSR